MKYNFDEIIDRRNTNAEKVEALKTIWKNEDLIPLWVADMDFRTPPFIMEALRCRCEHEILGYTVCPQAWYDAIIQWLRLRHKWSIQPHQLGFVPGIVPGIAFAVQCFTEPGDKVMIQPPVYPPFFSMVEKNNRKLVTNSLLLDDGQYRMNFEKMREDIKGCKLFILCSPHNPGGRVWNQDELATIADICDENGVLVISDEIHADLTFPSFNHIPFAMVSEKASKNSLVFMAPSKTFNIPGLASSYYIAENAQVYATFTNYLHACGIAEGNIFAFTGAIAAYSNGTEWLDQLLDYVQENIDFVEKYIAEKIPVINIIRPQASFLVLLDCRKLGLPQKELTNLFSNKAHLALNNGTSFGKQEGEGFMRLNVATPRSVLQKALRQLEKAVMDN